MIAEYLKSVFYILNPIQTSTRMLKGLNIEKMLFYTESYTKLETSAEKVKHKKCVLYSESYTTLETSAERVYPIKCFLHTESYIKL